MSYKQVNLSHVSLLMDYIILFKIAGLGSEK